MSFARLALRGAMRTRVALPVYCTSLRFPARAFSAGAGLDKAEIQERVLDVLKGFEKVEASKVQTLTPNIQLYRINVRQLTTSASFAEDLGLDSLDAVEVVMAVEDVRLLLHSL